MCRVVVPQNDIHTLVVELVGHGLHSRTAHTDTGTDRVDPLIVGLHCNLGSRARITGSAANLNDFLGDLGHFNLEQLNQHLGACAAEDQLRAASFLADFGEYRAHPVINPEGFASDQLLTGQQALGIITEINNDIVTGNFLDCAGN